MNRLESMGSQESEGMMFPYGAYEAFMREQVTHDSMRVAGRRVGQSGVPGGVMNAQVSTGMKRRRAQAVRRGLGAMFDAVEGVDDLLNGGQGGGRVQPREGSVGCGLGAKVVGMSEDVSNGSALTAENLQQSTSMISDSHGGRGGVRDGGKHQYVSLVELLTETERGSKLTLPEAKALVYSLAEDLRDIHAGCGVHTSVCLSSTALGIVDGTGRACLLRKSRGGVYAHAGAAVRAGEVAVVVHQQTMPPEMAHCRQDMMHRLVTAKGNMWSLGCIMFALLSGGVDPFGAQGVGVCGGAVMLLSVDRQQSWLSSFMADLMRSVNGRKVGGDIVGGGGSEEGHGDATGMERVFAVGRGVVGFDRLASDLLLSLLRVDPAQRLSAEEVLCHPWFDAVRERMPQGGTAGSLDCGHTEGDLGNTRRSSRSGNDRSLSDNRQESDRSDGFDGCGGSDRSEPSERSERSERPDLKYSRLHQKYIFIDPSVLSPMHPYTLIGHVKKEIEFESLGETYGGIGVFAVYNVPHHGTMMSAKPIKVIPH